MNYQAKPYTPVTIDSLLIDIEWAISNDSKRFEKCCREQLAELINKDL
tara:strand:+ start:577 stop:720 length:144 start_codon:yes stop_codon:yes gene_type:complete